MASNNQIIIASVGQVDRLLSWWVGNDDDDDDYYYDGENSKRREGSSEPCVKNKLQVVSESLFEEEGGGLLGYKYPHQFLARTQMIICNLVRV